MREENNNSAEFAARWVSAQTPVSAYIRSAVRDVHHQEDVLQNVARVAFEQMHKYDLSRPFLPWVLGIARNLILQYYRTNKQDRLVFSDTTLYRIEQAYEDLPNNDSQRREALAGCIEKLQDKARECVRLRYGQGVQVQGIAEQLGKTPNAISLVLFRARESLKKCVENTIQRGASS